ncbi:crotonase/enoyl-CoA hydratase family protein [Phreatobacter aquaticus]|uniref:Crotonase/enoyl-CoA hydratase family protein n=1 Tax=Phreatobacter aquaticus TaxID=2570229 RepID=A0A4D7QSV1_9HYPH|nr:crotonase/enoyl-CoA hydratase family protein [Phreatobacter aquaticus]QCK88576.1 crotonase/enoyl-CoA hydratase family protein [Phreatobacter aquaticus]
MKDRIAIDIADGVADVRMIRAAKMNALDGAMFDALIEAGEQLATMAGLRAVVLSGEGKAFCAGLDFESFQAMMAPGGQAAGVGDLVPRTHGIANRPQQTAWTWRALPVPVIAAVHGVAYGGGFQIALGADIRIAAPDARFSVMEIKWGLVPDLAGTQLMRHLAREDVVRELTYTGRVFGAEEAQRLGFVTRVEADARGAALVLARDIAGKSPTAMRASKRLLNRAVEVGAEEGLLDESREQQALIGSPNQMEAVAANLAKRAPRFVDPS